LPIKIETSKIEYETENNDNYVLRKYFHTMPNSKKELINVDTRY